ncbi:MAG: hypothetical protein ABIH00_03625 [Armatimonadota bacterium]
MNTVADIKNVVPNIIKEAKTGKIENKDKEEKVGIPISHKEVEGGKSIHMEDVYVFHVNNKITKIEFKSGWIVKEMCDEGILATALPGVYKATYRYIPSTKVMEVDRATDSPWGSDNKSAREYRKEMDEVSVAYFINILDEAVKKCKNPEFKKALQEKSAEIKLNHLKIFIFGPESR